MPFWEQWEIKPLWTIGAAPDPGIVGAVSDASIGSGGGDAKPCAPALLPTAPRRFIGDEDHQLV